MFYVGLCDISCGVGNVRKQRNQIAGYKGILNISKRSKDVIRHFTSGSSRSSFSCCADWSRGACWPSGSSWSCFSCCACRTGWPCWSGRPRIASGSGDAIRASRSRWSGRSCWSGCTRSPNRSRGPGWSRRTGQAHITGWTSRSRGPGGARRAGGTSWASGSGGSESTSCTDWSCWPSGSCGSGQTHITCRAGRTSWPSGSHCTGGHNAKRKRCAACAVCVHFFKFKEATLRSASATSFRVFPSCADCSRRAETWDAVGAFFVTRRNAACPPKLRRQRKHFLPTYGKMHLDFVQIY